jgi:hypothetical protein
MPSIPPISSLSAYTMCPPHPLNFSAPTLTHTPPHPPHPHTPHIHTSHTHQPHAPYYAPKEFFDKLPHYSQVPLPRDPFAPVGMPVVAWHPYADVSGMGETPAFNGTVNMTRLQVGRARAVGSTE